VRNVGVPWASGQRAEWRFVRGHFATSDGTSDNRLSRALTLITDSKPALQSLVQSADVTDDGRQTTQVQ
jgi:hypothetical protein